MTDPSQLVNLDELVRVATKYGLTVKVTGAADSATGTVGINDALSVSRADYIASELNKRGLPSDRITKTGEGGISDYVPTEANRHSKVELFFDKLEKRRFIRKRIKREYRCRYSLFSRCCIPDSLSRISVARFEIFVVIPEEFCLYRGVVDHFQLAAIQAVDYFSIFFRQLEIKLYKNKAMNFNLFQSRDSRRFFSRVSVLPELKYIFICRLRDGVVPAVILLSE